MSLSAIRRFIFQGMNVVLRRIGPRLSFLFRMRFKPNFVKTLPPKAYILDVGCGNDSPRYIKGARPDAFYTGLDVGNYNQTESVDRFADEYLIVAPNEFASTIAEFKERYDGIISAHNLEHCDAPFDVLAAMILALKPGGMLYLSFPCEESVAFPSRRGTLNFYDDATHKHVLPFDNILKYLKENGCAIEFAAKRYRPFPLFVLGYFSEPESIARNQVIDGTWAYWGFESLIWARRQEAASAISLG